MPHITTTGPSDGGDENPECVTRDDQWELVAVIMERLERQDRVIAEQRSEIAGLRLLVNERADRLSEFADALASASGWVQREAESFGNRLR